MVQMLGVQGKLYEPYLLYGEKIFRSTTTQMGHLGVFTCDEAGGPAQL